MQEGETINHLFIYSPYALEVWWFFLRLFGVFVVLPLEIMDLLRSCSAALFKKRGKVLWRDLPSVIIWSIWEERNLRIFQDKKRSVRQLIECINTRVAFWAFEEPCFKDISMDSLLRDFPIIINSAPSSPQVIHNWSLPIGNALKLNFDGSSMGNPGPAGLGGTIFDASGDSLVAYSGPLSSG